MQIDQLLKMLNKIDGFFRSEPDTEEAIKNIADHVNRFWDPRMRSKIVAYVNEGGTGLSDRALAAVGRLNPTSARFQMKIEDNKEEKKLENQEAEVESVEEAEALLSALAGR